MIKAIIFDLDNTLMNRNEAFNKFAYKLIDKYIYFSIENERKKVHEILRIADRDGYRSKEEIFQELSTILPWKYRPSIDEFISFWFSEFPKFSVPMENALEVIKEFKRRNIKLGIITNGSIQTQHSKIDCLGIRKYFDDIIVSDEVKIHKPNTNIFKISLERLEVLPQEACYIGDHPINDIKGATEAGMKAIWLKGFREWDDSLVEPEMAIDNLKELLELV
ncbi:HAD family hydrolase [Bacillus salitolerans]|uniref:HAD family hydrolase n=1 Tax=Bacillus salitolerans TaxID=1437434 RepID=A0ABW4LRR5_9BACI